MNVTFMRQIWMWKLSGCTISVIMYCIINIDDKLFSSHTDIFWYIFTWLINWCFRFWYKVHLVISKLTEVHKVFSHLKDCCCQKHRLATLKCSVYRTLTTLTNARLSVCSPQMSVCFPNSCLPKGHPASSGEVASPWVQALCKWEPSICVHVCVSVHVLWQMWVAVCLLSGRRCGISRSSSKRLALLLSSDLTVVYMVWILETRWRHQ